MIGENFPFLIAVSILSIIFVLSFFHIYSGVLEKGETVSLHRKGLTILSAFLKDYENTKNKTQLCEKWKGEYAVNYKIRSPRCEIGINKSKLNETEKLITVSSPVLIKNDTEIGEVNVSVWK